MKFDGNNFLPYDAPGAQPENAPAMYNEAEQPA